MYIWNVFFFFLTDPASKKEKIYKKILLKVWMDMLF